MNQARSFELRFIIFCSARCFFLLIYTIIFYTHPLSPYEPNRPYPLSPISMSFKSRRLDCLRIVASLQFEFLRDLHKSFRPHNSTEITVYSVSLVVCIFPSYYIVYYTIEKYIIYLRTQGGTREIEKKLNSNRQNIATDWGTIFQEF